MIAIKAKAAQSGAKRLALYVAFIAISLLFFWNAPADDLSSSFLACRLLASGDGSHLYDFHPTLFHVVDTAAWHTAAAEAGFTGFLHPYVQTPLWAWVLQPACTSLSFGSFAALMLIINLMSLVALIELVARNWARLFMKPFPLALLLLAITASTPFQYASWLGQIHMLFVLLALTALDLAGKNRPVLAGALLALACAVKVTPGLLLIYWLVKGHWRAVLWFAFFSAALVAATLATTGYELTVAYINSLHRVADVLLVAFNNQSLAAWLGDTPALQAEIGNWRLLALPTGSKLICLMAAVASMAVWGWLARRHQHSGFPAAAALIALTVFSPIAWSHYFLVLVPAAMLLANAGSWLAFGALILVFILNVPPVAVNPFAPEIHPLTLVRSHFVAAVILMLMPALVYPEIIRKRVTTDTDPKT